MNIEIISVWESQYIGLERNNALCPLTTPHLAALFPSDVKVTIRNELVRPVDYDIDVDIVAISFLLSYAARAYEIADRFRMRGVSVIMGGFHASALPEEALKHADAVVVGEAEDLFPEIIEDFKRKSLKQIYKSTNQHSLKGLPMPRYDLIEDAFILKRSIQATRGCSYKCTFCSVKSLYPNLRVRPVDEVIRDITCFEGQNYLQNKMIVFVDYNLTSNKKYAKDLFKKITPLKKWWVGQVSIDVVDDKELIKLAAESGCVSALVGIETFSQDSLKNVGKEPNKVSEYKKAIKIFHEYGIYVMAGLIIGFDEDTVESIRKIPELVQEIGIDYPYLQVLTPNYGTEIYDQYNRENRILTKDWSLYSTFNAVFRPKNMSVDELHSSYMEIWKEMHSVNSTCRRVFSDLSSLRLPSSLWRFLDNGYFMYRNLMGKYPLVGVRANGRENLISGNEELQGCKHKQTVD